MITSVTTLGELAAIHAELGVTKAVHSSLGSTHTVTLTARPAPGCPRQCAQGVGSAVSMLIAHQVALCALRECLMSQAHYADQLARLGACDHG